MVLDPTEFKNGLAKFGVNLSSYEQRYLIMAFDKDGDGNVSLDEFVRALRGSLNARRRKVVLLAFQKFDKDANGNITIDDLVGLYHAEKHPEVIAGRRTEAQVLNDFLKVFDSESSPDGVVTQEEFECYYAGVSSNIDSDDYFEAMVLRSWQLDDPNAPRLATTERIGGPSGPTGPMLPQDAYCTTKLLNSRNYDTSHMRIPKSAAAPKGAPPKALGPKWDSTYKSDYPSYDGEAQSMARAVSNVPDEVVFSPTGNPVLDRVRRKIIERGGKDGFLGLARCFRVNDRNRSGSLEVQEMRDAMAKYRVALSAMEMDTIMKNFDTSGDGNIDLTEFLRGVRGPMVSLQRIDIVKKAFQRLEKDNDGRVTLNDIAAAFDVEKHPDVINKKRTKQEVLREFVSDWDKNGDGEITWEEFLEYYSNISAGIDSDQYFELMVRNAWHISGGTGVAANTTCRRVLVTFTNGDQKVLEITDDLGIRKDNIQEMIRNLNQRGITDIAKIELAGNV
jgi:Ca2+-binding EF-hand superfamily protein